MRIVSGIAKGRKLKCPSGKKIRPTSDMVKEALFNMIGSDIIESRFLDLFAGTGNIGIEALSRGAAICYFVEKVYNNIKYIKENIKVLESTENAKILHMDANYALNYFKEMDINFDIIYIDPPYYQKLYVEPLNKISDYKILSDNGYIIVEHHKKDILDDTYGNLKKLREQKYGETRLTFYKEVTHEDCGISG
ncbi:16S rRNA (guanine(966)-N(2))-methyltransferase RsmD [Thermoanaerobacterium sp. RBIITD]|uniref:16S rRNA (guanine(966)-N(2))-methyltransferase RsmD n=1 Tax=Thermoanaerobacterium sp. RBIITD TaxID=1550240 RepID=UPI000BB69C45|nr:16S rRNA (guanine(966)-N(2))-methyltransferase RsmD [Thermoanaerobacterium sp. RBIITD]SNX55578.1 16S rRNA (guanine(966)-N(2))-methyltransferase RsmD [Thermoanaerobacterium sp. RBIITD]